MILKRNGKNRSATDNFGLKRYWHYMLYLSTEKLVARSKPFVFMMKSLIILEPNIFFNIMIFPNSLKCCSNS